MDTALFSPSSLYQDHDDDEGDGDGGERRDTRLFCTRLSAHWRHSSSLSFSFCSPFSLSYPSNPSILSNSPATGVFVTEGADERQVYVERTHAFPGMELVIREFSFHHSNANLLWPGTFAFSEWLVQNHSILQGRHILELGSGTGALSIFLRKSFVVDITTSDFDDKEVEENIAYNCKANGLEVLPHIRHSWGDIFPVHEPGWDLIIASDILLYVKQYSNLIRTLSFLLKFYKQKNKAGVESSQAKVSISVSVSGKVVQLHWPMLLMSWRRRIGKEEEAFFFSGCRDAGLVAEHVGSRVYCISVRIA